MHALRLLPSNVKHLTHSFSSLQLSCRATNARDGATLASSVSQHFYKINESASSSSPSYSSLIVNRQKAVVGTTAFGRSAFKSAPVSKLNAKDRKSKIFIMHKAESKKQHHSNFYGKRQPARVNDTYIAQLLDAYAENGRVKSAMAIFERLRKRGARPSVYNYRKLLYVVGYRGRDVTQAELIFEDMQLSRDPQLMNDRYCHNTMLHTYAMCMPGLDGYTKARKLFDAMKSNSGSSLAPNSFSYFYLLKCFVPRGKRTLTPAPQNQEEQEQEQQQIPQQTHNIELNDETGPIVQQLVDEMVRTNVVLLSNRHIQGLLQRMNMLDYAEQSFQSQQTKSEA